MLLVQYLFLGAVSLGTCFGKIIGDQTQTWMDTKDFPLTFSYTFKIWDPEAANKEREITIDVEYDAITTAERRLSACLSIASAPLNQTGVPEPFWITGAQQSWIGEGEKKLFATNYVSAHASRTSCDEEGVKRCDLHMGKTQPGSWSSFKCKGATDGMVNVKGGTLKRPEGVPSQAYAAWSLGFIGPEVNEVNWYNGVKN